MPTHRYNLFQSEVQKWPMDVPYTLEKQPCNLIGASDGHSHHEEIHNLVEQLYVNSDGFALLLDRDGPLFVENKRKEDQLCYSVEASSPYSTNASVVEGYLDLKFRIVAGTNMRNGK